MDEMKCPHCGGKLTLYEEWEDYSEYFDDILKMEEHWECNACSLTFSRDVKYKMMEKGELEE